MAAVTVLPVMNGEEEKCIHPFFSKINGHREQRHGHETTETQEESYEPDTVGICVQLDGSQEKTLKPNGSRKVKTHGETGTMDKKQKTLQDVIEPKHITYSERTISTNTLPMELSSEQGISPGLRKRRRTGPDEFVEISDETDSASAVPQMNTASSYVTSHPPMLLPDTLPAAQLSAARQVSPPRKLLRLHSNGTFSSPISKDRKEEVIETSSVAFKRRGRPRKLKGVMTPRQLFVKLKYSSDSSRREDIGQKIDLIFAGKERVPVYLDKKESHSSKPNNPEEPSKATHPFFMSKTKEQRPISKHESPRKASATTPGKLRRQILGIRTTEIKEMPYALGLALLKDRLMVKQPGACEPAWPDREQTHVRGLNHETDFMPCGEMKGDIHSRSRKQKNARLPFPVEESILTHFALGLQPEQDHTLRQDGFYEPHPSLHLPRKLLISGHDIRERIAPELRASLLKDDELSASAPSHLNSHTALNKLWNRLPQTLTAFDHGRGETKSWAQKYAPCSASEVLQPARETTVLREWLKSLTVTAVESVSVTVPKPSTKSELRVKRKRRRKPGELDDFLVESEEELHNMDEFTDIEDVHRNTNSKTQRSVVQVALDGAKISNAVLLSGPHGCGKTAAAYAVAKELGFKIFEIGPHERRSGKDVLDKVGNMTENHLVKHHGNDTADQSSAEESNNAKLDEAFQKDLVNGRQGTMSSFFKPSAPAKAALITTEKLEDKKKALKAVQQAVRRQHKDQRQSLILLEEVDIIFKGDKDFWSTVLKLIITSKRPFVMTCNDEDLVPLQAMNLHAILRFGPPPVELSADYMLLIAATEGHLLKRKAVVDLYEVKKRDLRASITELDFWCQMGIGDPRGGLSWIYQRWPPGSDLDAYGQKLRVISDNTYHSELGLDAIVDLSEDQRVSWAWEELGTHPFNPPTWSKCEVNNSTSGRDDMKDFSKYIDCLSAFDVLSRVAIRGQAPLDTAQPILTEKARHQYIEGMALLQTDEPLIPPAVSMDIVAGASCIAARAFPNLEIETLNGHPIKECQQHDERKLKRRDFSCFDAISTAAENALSTGSGLVQSVFDGPLNPIALDLAPYVRSIVHYDIALEEERYFISENSVHKSKRARTTRAARSALEGGQRGSTRRERWFTKSLDLQAVLATAGCGWPKLTVTLPEGDASEPPVSSAEGV